MAALPHTRALIAELATAIGLAALPPDDSGGFHLMIGSTADIYLYGGDDATILIVAPIGPLPEAPEYGLVTYLLRSNLFDSDVAPFQVAVDDGGVLTFWGRVRIADVDGAALAGLVERVATRVGEIRAEIGGEPSFEGAPHAAGSA